jgi:hypothetical protein
MNDPYLDWLYMVIFTFILSVAYIGIGAFTFMHVRDSLSASPVEESRGISTIFNSEKLSQTLKTFENRARERARVVSGYSGVSDPSL